MYNRQASYTSSLPRCIEEILYMRTYAHAHTHAHTQSTYVNVELWLKNVCYQ